MKHPNPDKAEELGKMFLDLEKSNPGGLEVSMGCTAFNHECGTVACHAGWFAVIQGKSRMKWQGQNYSYRDAANEMAEFLGFKYHINLERWARNNPLLWGNEYGDEMFCDNAAFGKKIHQTLTLTDIGNRWLKVADRIRALRANGNG